MSKQEQWNVVAEKFETVADGLGMGIDIGIKPVVVAFNVLGYETRQSCEGHVDRGLPYPWIDILAPGFFEEARSKYFESQKAVREALLAQKPDEEVKRLAAIRDEARRVSEGPIREIGLKIHGLLAKFYVNRVIEFETVLVVKTLASFVRLEPAVGELYEYSEPDIKKEKLILFQKEMNDFGLFLRKLFFDGA